MFQSVTTIIRPQSQFVQSKAKHSAVIFAQGMP